MRVLIIPEDFRQDQFLLKPLFESLFWRRLDIAKSKIRVCQDPNLGGVGEALKVERIQEIVDRYKSRTDIFILCIDRDGEVSRRQALDGLEERVQVPDTCVFLAEAAWEEIETWALAGLENLPRQWRWHDIRSEVHVKETYFEPLVRVRRLEASPGRGRKPLGEEAARRIHRILQLCPEDFGTLATRLESACG
ncbi:MAG: hypothetical protein OXG36_07540 [Caldilineaceae bacterium]|nr:hypothetical protein [Caldilineaceae bacterium]